MATPLPVQTLIDNYLAPKLGYIQRVEVSNMLGKHTGGTNIQFPYGNWLTTITPLFRQNGTIVTPSSYDTTAGTAVITGLDAGDDITCDFTFQYFSNADLIDFYNLGLQRLNMEPPRTDYTFESSNAGTVDNYPSQCAEYLTQYAYKTCIDTLVGDLMGQRARIIFVRPDQLAGFLMQKSTEIEAYLNNIRLLVKGRSPLTFRSISLGRYNPPQQINDAMWTSFVPIQQS